MTPATIRIRIEAIIRTRCTRAMSSAAAAVILSEFELLPFPRPIERRMPDGRPCWCWSKDEPHEGWIHSPNCDETLATWVTDVAGRMRAANVFALRRRVTP